MHRPHETPVARVAERGMCCVHDSALSPPLPTSQGAALHLGLGHHCYTCSRSHYQPKARGLVTSGGLGPPVGSPSPVKCQQVSGRAPAPHGCLVIMCSKDGWLLWCLETQYCCQCGPFTWATPGCQAPRSHCLLAGSRWAEVPKNMLGEGPTSHGFCPLPTTPADWYFRKTRPGAGPGSVQGLPAAATERKSEPGRLPL